MAEKVILTKEGLKNLKEELEYLRGTKRREVAKRIKQALEFGDISENSEYDDAKNEQAFVEGRIKEIERMLRNAEVINEDEVKTTEVNVGTTVRIQDMETGEEFSYKIVGTTEADPLNNKISNASPVGNALLNHKIGEEVEIDAPVGKITYKILAIKK
ncbi:MULTISPECIES: transcription elongation factor GreA [unclassified Candidatus Frackibacter]|uniref:transcription elongation factor GreA n=1 Tax=unclassified Candidatus Frackibacter TaxID=2648818 RepID=UPI000887305D|nr:MULTISPECIES: transcription elongation factor GreA [unclassified Candidatus Frackibacter]SDC84633.1 transcription elongation factor GreA [Candidatus Frackibacter sp. WG11]SFM07000.1 transcription elongation factor GreA [Candidatus Frackibacter sp. WG13]